MAKKFEPERKLVGNLASDVIVITVIIIHIITVMAGILWVPTECLLGLSTYFTFTTVPYHELHFKPRDAEAQRPNITHSRSPSVQKCADHKSFCLLNEHPVHPHGS